MPSNLPSPSELLTLGQILELSGADEARVVELIDLGWLSPRQEGGERLFVATDVYRLRKLTRLSVDFELPSFPASIIVDLLERIEVLERQVEALKRMI